MKHKLILSLVAILTILACSFCFKAGEDDLAWPVIKTEAKPWTRWWWMGSAVDKPNLTYNLEELKNAGFGGVEITPIYGVKGNDKNEIPFLSSQWMEMLKHTTTEANRLGMKVDMNTGTGWPFGGPQITLPYAAGKVFFRNFTIHTGQSLSNKIMLDDPKQQKTSTLSCLMAYADNGTKLNLTSMVKPDGTLDWTAPAGEWQLIALFSGKTMQAVKRAAPGGEGLVMDHFSKEAVAVYLKRFTKAFEESGSPKPNTFFNDSYEVYNADWTSSFLDEFAKRRGYRLEDYLPAFIGEGNTDEMARVKSDYRETMSDILIDNFTKSWTYWAHDMGATTRNQAHGSPGNLIDIYATPDIPECETFGSTVFDIPGMERDTNDWKRGDADPMMLKFSSSAAHLTGHPFTSSETFTWLGEHFKVALSQCKPELDQLLLSGINHVFFHGSTYSPKDAVWPGWLFYASCEFSFNNSIWRDMSGLTGYISRCQSFLQLGRPDNEVMVYWPVYDLWHNATGMDMAFKIHDLRQWLQPGKFYQTTTWLRKNGFDMDYVSDHFLQAASVENGYIKVPGGEYKVLIIPECAFMPFETLKKIKALSEEGAKVIFAGSLPVDVPGLSNLVYNREQLSKTKESLHIVTPSPENTKIVIDKGEVMVTKLFPGLLEQIGIKGEAIAKSNIGYIRRSYEDGYIYFFANQQAKPFSGWVKLAVKVKSAAIFDPLTSHSGLCKIREGNDGTEVFLRLASDESFILKTWSDKKVNGPEWTYFQQEGKPVVLNGHWQLSMIQGTPAVKQTFKLDTLTSWTNLKNDDLKVFAGTGKYVLKFVLPGQKADDWQLDLGKVCESARVTINGKDAGIWWSIPFHANVGTYLQKGENTLEIEVTNLSANRIADMDRKGIDWRIYKEINFVDLRYKPFSAASWKLMDSGLIGPVTLTPMKKL
jgi:hypothetical protein